MADAAIYFATNRKPNDPDNPTEFTTDSVATTDPVRFGQARFENRELNPESDGDTDDVLATLGAAAKISVARDVVTPQDGAVNNTANLPAFADIIQSAAGQQQDALICIHGYDYTFRQSLARAAQLQYWYSQGPYGTPLLVFLLAWPSLGEAISINTYHEERNRARISGDAMARALMMAVSHVRAVVEPARINLLAHSMGNWALRWATQSLDSFNGGNIPQLFNQIALMAADEDEDTFSHHEKLQPILGVCNRISVYCNMYDLALTASDWIMGNPDRLGAWGPANPKSLPDKLTTISTAAVVDPVADGEQHQYYRMSREVRRHLLQVLKGVGDDAMDGRGHVRYGLQYVLTRAPGA